MARGHTRKDSRVADYYKVLGVARDANDEEIKKAYRRMSRKYHPDIAGPEFEDKFKEVNNAFAVLSNPQKRSMYDQGVDPNDPNASAYASRSGGTGFDEFGDIFGQFFGGSFSNTSQGPIPRAQEGRDTLTRLTIDLKTAVFGGVVNTEINTYGVCQQCKGSGSENGGAPVTCPVCHGRGFTQKVVRTLLGQMMTSAPCERCEGHGTILEHPCTACMGHGRVRVRRTVGVTIPAGITDGARLRLASQGEVGEGAGPAGDLYIDISVRRDKQFTRDGDDLHCWIQVPMSWAVLGHELTISTFDGPRTLSVPAGCQPGQAVELKGLGSTRLHANQERGDLIAHLLVRIPTKLSERERGLIESFAKAHDAGATQVEQSPEPSSESRKGFFGRLKDALS